jgi:hypothetical protein
MPAAVDQRALCGVYAWMFRRVVAKPRIESHGPDQPEEAEYDERPAPANSGNEIRR